MVIWFLGKSGAGKTFFGNKLYSKIKSICSNVVYLDGDELRAAISEDLSHTEKDRYISEKRRSRLCKLLSEQDIHVICSGISNATDIREWNKNNINEYFEIYLKTTKETLHKRDPKGLYKKYLKGEIDSIVGEDIEFYEPKSPWIEIDNNKDVDADLFIEKVFMKLLEKNLIR